MLGIVATWLYVWGAVATTGVFLSLDEEVAHWRVAFAIVLWPISLPASVTRQMVIRMFGVRS